MSEKLIIATRKSPLALKQTDLAVGYIRSKLPAIRCAVKGMSTTGDRQKDWSLEKKGGKGLFTKELEDALLDGRAHIAVHSAKDMPTTLPKGLVLAGYLPRANPADVLVMRKGIDKPELIATGSPRRREQAKLLFPNAKFTEIRGRVTTRLKKVESGECDATILAAAGLTRLGIDSWDNVVFRPFEVHEMVPAVGQGAIALECTKALAPRFSKFFDKETKLALDIERTFLAKLGGGCQVAYAAHYVKEHIHVFHQKVGYHKFPFTAKVRDEINEEINKIVAELKLI